MKEEILAAIQVTICIFFSYDKESLNEASQLILLLNQKVLIKIKKDHRNVYTSFTFTILLLHLAANQFLAH